MKLYFKPGACSMASHIALHEVAASFTIEEVDTGKGLTKSGADFRAINPKGYVPALQMAGGDVITEGSSILQFIADTHPEAGLAPAPGSFERARLQEHLNYVSSELHKAFSPLFRPGTDEAGKEAARANISEKLDYVASLLADGRYYLLGSDFTVADAYLFVVVGWSAFVGVDLLNWPVIQAYHDRIAARPSTVAAMKAEGLIQ